MDRFRIRTATAADAGIIARHRVAMFRDMGQIPSDALASELLALSANSLVALLSDGTYVGWLAIDGRDQVIAGAGVHIKHQLPRIAEHGTHVETAPAPLVVNVYTEPQWRGRGIARALMTTLMAWARERGFDRVLLHASDDGRPLYASLGFVPTNEMRWCPAGDENRGSRGRS